MSEKSIASLIENVSYLVVGDCQIHKNVDIGRGTIVEGPSIIGKPARGCRDGEWRTKMGSHGHVRPFSTIYAGNLIGDRFQTGQNATIREKNRIGDDVSV